MHDNPTATLTAPTNRERVAEYMSLHCREYRAGSAIAAALAEQGMNPGSVHKHIMALIREGKADRRAFYKGGKVTHCEYRYFGQESTHG